MSNSTILDNLKNIYNNIYEKVIVIDNEYNIIFINDSFIKRYNIDLETVKNINELSIELPKDIIKKYCKEVIENKTNISKKELKWDIRFIPIIDSEYICIIIKENLNFCFDINDYNEAVLITDLSGNVIDFNKKANLLLKYKSNKHINFFDKLFLKNMNGDILKQIIEKDYYKKEAIYIRENDKIDISFNVTKKTYRDEKYLLIFINDIREKTKYKKELQNYYKLMKYYIEPLIMFEADGTIHFFNEAAEKLYGLNREEIIGKKVYEILINENNIEMFIQMTNRVLKGKKIRNIELCDFSKNGSLRYTLVTLLPLYNSKGNVYRIVANIREITRIKNSENSLSILYSVVKSLTGIKDIQLIAQTAIIETVKHLNYSCGKIIYFEGDKFIELSRYTVDDSLLEDIVSIDNKLSIIKSTRKNNEMITIEDVDLLYNIEKTYNIKSLISVPLFSNEKLIGVMVIGNIRSLNINSYESTLLNNLGKQIGIALQNAILLEELKKKTIDLTVQNERVKESNRLKNEFLANMSHELRTPLNSIIGFSSLILEGLDGDLTLEQKKDMDIIKKSGDHLLRLINDVLDLSKIEANKIEFVMEKVDLYEISLECFSTIENELYRKKLNFNIELDNKGVFVLADRIRLKQVIINIVHNAIKFTQKGTIKIYLEYFNYDFVMLAIKDTGIGIPKRAENLIFEPFMQVDGSLTRQNGGTGLGMAISKQFIEKMGGSISFRSKYGKGTTFYIKIPAYIERK